jgi:PIN domain nuclease of toxin-antitoxin system
MIGVAMLTICDTHVLLFWSDRPERLSKAASRAVEDARKAGRLAVADVSYWEMAMLFRKGRLVLPADHSVMTYIEDIVEALGLISLPITPAIAALAESGIVAHGDPGDRLIAAAAMQHRATLITADEKLRAIPGLQCIW